jgi:hypothetical protein
MRWVFQKKKADKAEKHHYMEELAHAKHFLN